jgi:hypothetical protein
LGASNMIEDDNEAFIIPEKYIAVKKGISYKTIKEFHNKLSNLEKIDNEELKHCCALIFNKNASSERTKDIFVKLAFTGEAWAFRTIQKYIETIDDRNEWAIMALCESQRRIEEDLCEEPYGIISTGLGGERDLLRYIVIIKSKYDDVRTYNEIIEVWNRISEKNCSKIEELKFEKEYIWIKVLVRTDVAVGNFIEDGIRAVNKEMDILEDKYLVTNVGIPTEKDIYGFLNE